MLSKENDKSTYSDIKFNILFPERLSDERKLYLRKLLPEQSQKIDLNNTQVKLLYNIDGNEAKKHELIFLNGNNQHTNNTNNTNNTHHNNQPQNMPDEAINCAQQ